MSPFLIQIRQEWRYQRRRPFVWICMAIYFAIAFGDAYQAGVGQGGYQWVNGGDSVMTRAVVLSLLGILAVAGIIGESTARDRRLRMEECVLVIVSGRSALGFGRFLVAWGVCVLVGLMFVPGMLLGAMMPGIPAERLGPTDLSHYAKAMTYFLAPNFFISGAIVFAVGSRWRSQAAAYLAGVGLLVIWILARMLMGQDVLRHDVFPIYAMCEPFGTTASAQYAMEWTVTQNNERFVPLAGYLLANRVLWVAFASLLVLVSVRWLPMQPVLAKAERVKRSARLSLPGAGSGSEFWLTTRWEFLGLLRQPGLRLLLFFAAFSLWFAASSAFTHHYSLPTTDLLVHSTSFYFDKILILVLVWSAADLIWRERQHGMHEVVDAMPTRDTVRLLAKTVALIGIVLAFWLLAIVVNVVYQAANRFHHYELWLHFVDSFIFKAPYYLWMAVLALMLQVLVRQRFVAIGLFLLIYVAPVMMDALGRYHPLYRYGEVSFFWYSLLDGYGHFWKSHLWFLAYWTLGALIVWWVAWASMTRGTHPPSRWQQLLTGLSKKTPVLVALLLIIGFASVGSAIWYQTAVQNTWPLVNEDALKADVERQYGETWRGKPQPRVVEIRSEVDLFPEERRLSVRGEFVLKNEDSVPIKELLVLAEPLLDLRSVSFSSPAQLVERDETLKVEYWRLDQALAPGEEMTMQFETGSEPGQGFKAHAKNDSINEVSMVEVIGNGTSLLNLQLMPVVGYTDRVEHKPGWKRRKYGLAEEWQGPSGEPARRQAHDTLHLSWVREIDATITTSGDQIPLHAGTLVEDEKTSDGRRRVRYVVKRPSRGWSEVLSGRYIKRRYEREGIPPVEFFYDPVQTYTLDRMADEYQEALTYFVERYGEAPFDTLTMAQQSLHYDGMGNRAGLGFATEILGWKSNLARSKGSVIRKMAAHMMGMSWFGDQIIPANVAGAKVIHAGLPYWSAGIYLEASNDVEANRERRRQDMRELFRQRRSLKDEESPFILELKDSTMIRKKGMIMMTYLADLVGEKAIEASFQSFLEEWRYRPAPFPTAEDFMIHLQRQVPERYHPQLVDIFEKVTRWDLRMVEAKAEPLEEGRWQVRAVIDVRKFYTSGLGEEREVDFATPVSVALATGRRFSEESMLATKRIVPSSGRSEVVIECGARPRFIALDVDVLLPDTNLNDQVIGIE